MTETPAHDGSALAAVDLGSNSFHLIVAREVDGRPLTVDKLRERVALAEGLQDRKLDSVVQARALATLERMSERIKGIPPERVRAVGTATFRKLRDRGRFLRTASEALGVDIEIVSGIEEARLVYLGVAHTLGDDEGRRLVVDIGGASTECMLGEQFASTRGDSLAMGCVTWSRRFFPDGQLKRGRFDKAILAAQVELEPVARRYSADRWDHAIGSSGTIRTVAAILEGQGWSEGEVTRGGLKRLRVLLEEVRHSRDLDLPGLRPDRKEVIAGGVAVLIAVFEALSIKVMRPSAGALREGVLHDLVGRIHHEDVREESVASFGERLGQDRAHGVRCRELAEALFDQVRGDLALSDRDRLMVGWAAQLHDVGLVLAHSNYNAHGAYLVRNADLAGFSGQDRDELAALIHAQRRRPRTEAFEDLPPKRARRLRQLLPLLRIALRLRRDRSDRVVPAPKLAASGSGLALEFAEGWLEAHPLTHADLEREARHLGSIDVSLELR